LRGVVISNVDTYGIQKNTWVHKKEMDVNELWLPEEVVNTIKQHLIVDVLYAACEWYDYFGGIPNESWFLGLLDTDIDEEDVQRILYLSHMTRDDNKK
jgi:hypothetical protein